MQTSLTYAKLRTISANRIDMCNVTVSKPQPTSSEPTERYECTGKALAASMLKGTSTKMIEFVLHQQTLKHFFLFSTPQLDRKSKHY